MAKNFQGQYHIVLPAIVQPIDFAHLFGFFKAFESRIRKSFWSIRVYTSAPRL